MPESTRASKLGWLKPVLTFGPANNAKMDDHTNSVKRTRSRSISSSPATFGDFTSLETKTLRGLPQINVCLACPAVGDLVATPR